MAQNKVNNYSALIKRELSMERGELSHPWLLSTHKCPLCLQCTMGAFLDIRPLNEKGGQVWVDGGIKVSCR